MSTLVENSTPALSPDSYVLLGLATCYLRQEAEVDAVYVLEPIPSAYLHSLLQGIPTSYRQVWATTVNQALTASLADFSVPDHSPLQRCTDFEERLMAAARTYQSRPEATALIPAGTSRSDLNYSTERKRILNAKNKVSRADNVKQHRYTHEVV
ncbi:MAG: hypothetical protein KGQ93_06805 [Cyanobacteria bacterium REEB459]|nr:hypothetical protein [Cyanobacteria bacterium REEB459]